ncbi:hypothetical protein OS493_010497 [Desmophyllum pertusum]|uniref:Uncharacterized protein n=1 Tax=Desmophyllum pertusum TaxID=174260 RepID=A0A9X0A3Q4_9CNID|nr:hypothetical protein OS493_010497 [Desmophyllum pertusum]
MALLILVEKFFVYVTEKFTSGVIQSYQRQRLPEDAPLIQPQDPLEDFKKFNNNDAIFQEYDPPPGDDSKMGWKRSRPTKWWMSLWKAVKCVFCIQILGGLAVGSLAIAIVVLAFNSADLCYDHYSQSQNWTSLPRKIQAIIVAGESVEGFVVQMSSFLLIFILFGWPLVKKLNLMSLNLLVLMNSILVGREIANDSETERYRKRKKTIKVSAILAAQFVFAVLITLSLSYGIIPLYGRQKDQTDRAVIAAIFPLVTVIPKIIVRLAVQRIDFLHPGESHVLTSVLYSAFMIVFRVMQAELADRKLFILLSFFHGSVDLLERLTIVMRDYLWYFIYKKLKRDTDAAAMTSADTFRTPRSMRFIADMSIQMTLCESTALIAAVGFIQLYNFMYNNNSPSFADMHPIAEFFIRVAIALSIDFVFNSFSFWIQMSYLNVAVVRVWKKKWPACVYHMHRDVTLLV